LVMITELFDESLEVMRRLLCWDYDDVVYLPHFQYQGKPPYLSEEAKERLRNWFKFDYDVYNHFARIMKRKLISLGNSSISKLKLHRNIYLKKCSELLKTIDNSCKKAKFPNYPSKRIKCPCLPLTMQANCQVLQFPEPILTKLVTCSQKEIYNWRTLKMMLNMPKTSR